MPFKTKKSKNSALRIARFRASKEEKVILFPAADDEDLFIGPDDRSNLIIQHLCTDGSKSTLVQRLCPTSPDRYSALNTSLKTGRQLKDNLFSSTVCSEFTLGLSSFYGREGFTSQHRENRDVADPLLIWLSGFFTSHIKAFVNLLAQDVRLRLDAKGSAYDHLQKGLGSEAVSCIDPWWASVTIIKGCLTHSRTSKTDHQPCIWVNAGAEAVLELQLEKDGPMCEIWMCSGDILFIDTETLIHSSYSVKSLQEEQSSDQDMGSEVQGEMNVEDDAMDGVDGVQAAPKNASQSDDDDGVWTIILSTSKALVGKRPAKHRISMEDPPQAPKVPKRMVRRHKDLTTSPTLSESPIE